MRVELVFRGRGLTLPVVLMPDRVVTFDEDTVHERVGGKTTERTWSWLTRATEDTTASSFRFGHRRSEA